MGMKIEERDWLYSLSLIPGVGSRTLRQIYQNFTSFAKLAESPQMLRKMSISPEKAKAILEKLNPEAVWQDKMQREQRHIQFISIFDEQYPQNLREISDPPVILFYRGHLRYLTEPKLAVVGSRKPTPYGKAACAKLTAELAEAGFTIVSGVAYGIDAEAHRTALRCGAGTIGVLGCGLDHIYPPLHKKLYEEIADNGLLLSEYPPATSPHKGLFPERNRLISGLSLGVLLIEGNEKSGSLITVDCALDQGREVFAVPGQIFSPLSAAPHNLIKQGAKLVTGAADVLEELPLPHKPTVCNRAQAAEQRLSSGEQRLLELIPYEPIHWNKLFECLPPEARQRLDQELLLLEANGMIESLAGGYFAKRKNGSVKV
ncbi:DNA-processing protein DprA [Brevibacillus fulvus]|uniref:DNA processing protein n=1 Tax=Brevibacillus fulvus TaxID=1125967 RepID=A0A938Y1E2_9BACL|nr:DNA-processing protein DprA [Brevibacillus fulvus]MBM7590639.1 DNA processing protein [Brevibacillus fulvus]